MIEKKIVFNILEFFAVQYSTIKVPSENYKQLFASTFVKNIFIQNSIFRENKTLEL